MLQILRYPGSFRPPVQMESSRSHSDCESFITYLDRQIFGRALLAYNRLIFFASLTTVGQLRRSP